MAQITLYQFPAAIGLPSMSPFCTKVRMAVNLAELDAEIVDMVFAKRVSPGGKLPYLTWDGQGIEDSTAIIRAIQERVATGPRLVPEDPQLSAEVHLLEDWADESLYWFGLYGRFYSPANWPRYRPHLGAALPAGMRMLGPTVARRGVLKRLQEQGLTSRADALVEAEFARHLDALNQRLVAQAEASESGPYLVGEQISLADLAVVSALGVLTTEVTPDYRKSIAERAELDQYMKRIAAETGI